MRIAFVSHYALPHLGGIEVAIDALARELTVRGHDVVHVASSATSGLADESDAAYRVVRVPALNVLEVHLDVPVPIFGPQLLGVVRREVAHADVVHAHGFLYPSSVLALRAAARAGRARVLTEHVGHVPYESRTLDGVQRLAIARVGRMAVRLSQAVVVFNDQVAAEIAELGAGSRLVRIRNGVDQTAYRPPRPGERESLRDELGWDERPRVLFVGRLVAKKGLGLALEAAARADGAFELVVAGPGRAPKELPMGVELLGPQRRTRVAELYRAADALLLPSRGEGFPLTVHEAMASALPVVLLDDPSYRPYLAGAGRGARLADAQPDRLAAELRELLWDSEGRRAAGQDALRHARSEFSWGRAADAHETLYRSLAP